MSHPASAETFWNHPRRRHAVLFGQTREDATVELALLRSHPTARRIAAVASGGCTALALRSAAAPEATVWGIDINSAQIHLCRWKLAALQQTGQEELLAALERDGRPLHATLMREALEPAERAFWEKQSETLRYGANHCGTTDQRLRQLMPLFHILIASRRRWEKFLSLRDPAEQSRMLPVLLAGIRWRLSFRIFLGRPVLRAVFGRKVAATVPKDFPEVIRRRIERSLTVTPARENPYAWQTFLARFAANDDAALPPAWQREAVRVIRATAGRLHFEADDIVAWLLRQPGQSVDFIALSNIHEGAPPEFLVRLQTALVHATAPGAIVVARSILPASWTAPEMAALPADPKSSAAASLQDRGGVVADVRVWRRLKISA